MGDLAEIHAAAIWGDHTTLRRVLAEGVSPDAIEPRFYGRTPLHFLCDSNIIPSLASGLVVCFELLRDAGANLEAVDADGHTPLHYAADVTSTKIMSLLVEAGVNVNAVDSDGYTALHIAALGSADCVEVLLAAGADVNVRTNSGRTPFDYAIAHDHRHMWPVFLRAGAEIPTNNTDPYIVRVRNAGGFQRYEQQHLARIASILETPLLPPELVRKVLEFWLHAGYY